MPNIPVFQSGDNTKDASNYVPSEVCVNKRPKIFRVRRKVRMSETEDIMIERGLGYMKRVMIRDLDIEAHASDMKDFLWNTVLSLIEKANELNLKWKYVDIAMQIKHRSPYMEETASDN